MGGGSSSSRNETTTNTISDSGNWSSSTVSNLSDVGNTTVNFGAQGWAAEDIVKLLPFAIIGGVLMLVVLAITRRQ
jgi:hypothetical protein